MLRLREEYEQVESSSLAPYAQLSANSHGRAINEPSHEYRTAFQRDRARIIHAKAFRRLEMKTQVFRGGSGDHLRNRLTHTIEVTNVGRGISRALALNEDLTEAIALAHDLGHPPFGHSGEETLDRLMKDHGGFDHNNQSLRIVELLEQPYPVFKGLNLSYEVLEGLRKHAKFHQIPDGETHQCPSLEAQVANLADEIAYYSHDLDDGLRYGILAEKELEEVEIWKLTRKMVGNRYPGIAGRSLHAAIIRFLIDSLVEDVITTTARALKNAGIRSVREVRAQPKPLVRYGDKTGSMNKELRSFLYQRMYYSEVVSENNSQGCKLLEEVFHAYLQNPDLIPKQRGQNIPQAARHRPVCDYVAGMTDSFLAEQHSAIFGR